MKFPRNLALLGLVLMGSGIALGVDTPTRTNNTVIVGNGVAGTKSITFDIGGSNPLVESVSGVLKLSTNGTNLMSVPAATDTFVGKATTDTLTNKSIGGGLTFNGATSGTTLLQPTAVAGSTTLTLPAATDTLVGKATTDTLTNKTLTTPAITGAWTATGDLTQTTAGGINWLLNNTATTGSTTLTLRSGNGTTSANNRYIEFGDNDASQQTWDIGHVGTNDLTFYDQTGGKAVASVTGAGQWTIGSTALDVAHSIQNTSQTNQVLNVRNGDSTTNSDARYGIIIIKGSATNTSSQKFIEFTVSAGGIANGGIAGNGANAAAFISVSDRRLKTNIVGLPGQLAKIRQLRPVEFDYKDGSGHQIGFIAQDMQEVYQDSVSKNPETGMLSIAGWDKTSARLVSALKEVADKNDALESRVQKLEAKVALLEATPKQ